METDDAAPLSNLIRSDDLATQIRIPAELLEQALQALDGLAHLIPGDRLMEWEHATGLVRYARDFLDSGGRRAFVHG